MLLPFVWHWLMILLQFFLPPPPIVNVDGISTWVSLALCDPRTKKSIWRVL
jgi:hypothetical protein